MTFLIQYNFKEEHVLIYDGKTLVKKERHKKVTKLF